MYNLFTKFSGEKKINQSQNIFQVKLNSVMNFVAFPLTDI